MRCRRKLILLEVDRYLLSRSMQVADNSCLNNTLPHLRTKSRYGAGLRVHVLIHLFTDRADQ